MSDLIVYKVTRGGEVCHYGVRSTAYAYAGKNGLVEEIKLVNRDFVIVSQEKRDSVESLRQQLATTERLLAESQALVNGLQEFDAGLLNDFGGGNVDWWWGYIRYLLGSAHDHYVNHFSSDSTALDAAIAAAKEPLEYQIDTLMQEYCPDEITSEQWARIEAHTRVSDGADELKGGEQG